MYEYASPYFFFIISLDKISRKKNPESSNFIKNHEWNIETHIPISQRITKNQYHQYQHGNKRDQSVTIYVKGDGIIGTIFRPNPTEHTFVRVRLGDGASNFATPHDLRLRGAGRGASQRHVAPLPHLHIRAGGVVQDIRWYWNNDHIATTTTSPPPSCTERNLV